jgi:iron complex outermembrane recepter protein
VTKTKLSLVTTVAPMMALLLPAPAAAQAAPADDEAGVSDIVVTAQRREQNLQDVPLSVTAITGATLSENSVVDITTLQKLAPGLQFGQSGTDARPAIRGARTDNISNQQDPIVSFFVDGIYRSRTSQALAAFVDVNRVEVLRGPQGTLYGRNSFGGAINIISNAPQKEASAGGNITIGNYRAIRADGYVNAPLSDTVSIRLSASYDTHDGYVRNSFDKRNDLFDKDETYVRAQIRWEPSENFDATVRASIWKQGGNGGSDFGYSLAGRPIDATGGSFTFDDAINARIDPVNPRVGSGNGPADPGPYRVARDAAFDLDTEQRTIDFEGNYNFGSVAAKLLVGYTDFSTIRTADADLSVLSSGFEFQEDRAKTFSQELQFSSSGEGAFAWTVGGFHLKDDTVGIFAFDRIFATDAATNRPILTTPAAAGSDFNSLANVDTKSLAFYGQGTYSLTESLRATGGIRWTRDKKDFSRQTNGNFTSPLAFTSVPFRDDATFKKITYRGALEADLSEDNLVYASISTGFQAGGFNNSADSVTGGASFDEQKITAYEIGSKNTFANGTVTANLSLYWNDFSGLLANEFVNVGSTVLTISTNAGAARAKGAELELAWRPNRSLSINGALTLNDAKFRNYTLQEPISGVQRNIGGERIPLTPDFTARVGFEYKSLIQKFIKPSNILRAAV